MQRSPTSLSFLLYAIKSVLSTVFIKSIALPERAVLFYYEKQGHIKGAFHRDDIGDIDLLKRV